MGKQEPEGRFLFMGKWVPRSLEQCPQAGNSVKVQISSDLGMIRVTCFGNVLKWILKNVLLKWIHKNVYE